MEIYSNTFIDRKHSALIIFVEYNMVSMCMILCCMRKVEQFVIDITLKSLNYDLYEEMKTPGGECLSHNK